MNSKERLFAVMRGEQPDVVPVCPHWWGNYKFEISGKDHMLDRWGDGESMVPIYRSFYERFRPDWFHLSGGYPRHRDGYPSRDYRAVREGERLWLIAPDGSRDEILADENLASHKAKEAWDKDMTIQEAIDCQLEHRSAPTAGQLIEIGVTDHAREIVRQYGDEVFVCVNVGAPGVQCLSTYERSMIALYDYPEGVKRLVQSRYQEALEWAKAFSTVGVHGWLISEDVAGADTISPRMYEEMLYPSDVWFFEQVARLGMVSMVYFCGDVRPLIPLIRESGAKALLIEDNRKTFSFDVVAITRQLQGKVALFGNIDTTELMLYGKPAEVEDAVRQQLRAAEHGPFVVANGSPLAPGTPPENVDAMIRAARKYGRLWQPACT
jgi:uroporphyrinogen-III decarboxylase